jgi:malonyl-CoA O-methyltransferase
MADEALIQLLETREGYDRWSEFYDVDGNPLIGLEQRYFSPLLGEVRGLRVADVGCGTGRHAAQLARAGASVTAIDFSTGMMRKGREKPGANRVGFAVADLGRPLPLRDSSFDRVICCLVLDHIFDVAGLFAEMRRICRRGGFIAISSMHPAMMLKGLQAQFHDPETGARVRPRSAPNQICDYVNAAAAARLRIAHMSEHAVDDDLAAQFPRAQKYLGWPMLLLMKLVP